MSQDVKCIHYLISISWRRPLNPPPPPAVITGSAQVPLARACKCTITPAFHFNADVPGRRRFAVGWKLNVTSVIIEAPVYCLFFFSNRELQPHNKLCLPAGTWVDYECAIAQMRICISMYIYLQGHMYNCTVCSCMSQCVWVIVYWRAEPAAGSQSPELQRSAECELILTLWVMVIFTCWMDGCFD